MEGYAHIECCTPRKACENEKDVLTFVVRSTNGGAPLVGRVPCRALTKDVSPVLTAMVAEWEPLACDEEADQHSVNNAATVEWSRGEQDTEGRYILDGPTNPHAFAALMEAVRQGGFRAARWPCAAGSVSSNAVPAAPGHCCCRVCATRPSDAVVPVLPDLEARLEACRYSDYYLLPLQARMQFTKELLSSFIRSPSGIFSDCLDATKLGLCRSDMVLDKIHLEGLTMRGLQLENSHVRKLVFQNCNLVDSELAMCVTANEVMISRSKLQSVKLGVFASKVSIEDSSTLVDCNIRVVEELLVKDCSLSDCTFRGSDEDRKERQLISAVFRCTEMHGDVTMPFDKVVCEQTSFHGSHMQMTKAGASVSFVRARVHLLPSSGADSRMSLCLEDCDVMKALAFRRMRLTLRGVHFTRPCEMVDVEFPEKVCDITFPRTSGFKTVRFRQGLQACTASGCNFEGCNLGYGQDAVSDCLLTRCSFQACRFPFLEADSPVANFSNSNFVGCQIQWSGQFPHEESFVINSCWLRKWNLSGCSVTDGL